MTETISPIKVFKQSALVLLDRHKWYLGFGLIYLLTILLERYTAWHVSIPCLFKKLFGINCPGCGLSRAIVALLEGHITEAWHHNALLFVLIPVLGFTLVQQWISIYHKIVHVNTVP